MAVCEYCNQEMTAGVGCKSFQVTIGTEVFAPIKYGEGRWAADLEPCPCHDCAAPWGSYHHPGCDMEECPKCHGQLISCGHLNEFERPAVTDVTESNKPKGIERPDIEAIAARLQAATPGPWGRWHDEDTNTFRVFRNEGRGYGRLLAIIEGEKGRYESNTTFIAHAPADLAALLAYIKALKSEL